MISEESAAASKRLAAIDIGSNSVRLMVAEARRDGNYRILDDEKKTTRLARGLARSGLLTEAAVADTLAALGRMKVIAEGYEVERLGVIATSAVREAGNGQQFVQRVRDQLGLQIDIITPSEEGQLSFRSVEHHFDLKHTDAVVVDLGGGSVELVLAANGIVDVIYSLPLGAVRMTEAFLKSDPVTEDEFHRLRKHVRRCLKEQVGAPAVWPHLMIGSGGTFMALAAMSLRIRGQTLSQIGGYEMTRSEVRHILEYLRNLPLRARKSVPGLNADRADIIVAGVAVIERLMKVLKVNRLQIHDRGIRDGLLLKMISHAFGRDVSPTEEQLDPLDGVHEFARACGFEQRHSQHVADLCAQLFDQLRDKLKLPPGERLILQAAALLHEIGYLINYQKHHLHSYHLIMHGNLRGLSPRQRELVANVARYHRRSGPKPRHENFARLTPADRDTVRRLSAILKLVDGLDRTHMQRVKALHAQWDDDRVLLDVTSEKLPDVDLWGARKKGNLFQKVFGVKLEFAWRPAEATNGTANGAALRPMNAC